MEPCVQKFSVPRNDRLKEKEEIQNISLTYSIMQL